MAFPTTGNTFFDLLMGCVVLIGAAWGINRQIGHDKLVRTKQDGEGGWINAVVKERQKAIDDARANFDLYALEKQRADRAEMLSEQLEQQHEADQEKIAMLERQVHKLTMALIQIDPSLRPWLSESGFGDLFARAPDPPVTGD